MHLAFDTITFIKDSHGVRGVLLKHFTFSVAEEQLRSVGPYTVDNGALVFDAHEKKRNRALHILRNAMDETLTCTLTKNPARYLDRTLGIPLIGALEFGIIDRGTNLIEVRPATGCNLCCTYCSVNEGIGGPKRREFVIEKDFLVEAFGAVAAHKQHPIEVFIETQGEPLLYADLPGLITDLRARYPVARVTMVTNGTLLTETHVHALKAAGLDRINWSINSLQPERAARIAGRHYDVERIKERIRQTHPHIPVLLCPVLMHGVNDDEIDAFVTFARDATPGTPLIGFQNFLWYKGGRNPVEEIPWQAFHEQLLHAEERHGVRLRVTAEDFSIVPDGSMPKPFRKKDMVDVERLFPGRLPNETYCAAHGRLVKVLGRTPDKQRFPVQIIREKHNIFTARTA